MQTFTKKQIQAFFTLLLLGGALLAQNPLAPTEGFLIFTEGDAILLAQESEGPVAVGGDLIMDDHPVYANYRVANNDPGDFFVGSDLRPTALLVNGRVHFLGGEGIKVNQNGYVKIGDCTGANVYNTDPNNASVNTRITGGSYFDMPRIALSTQQPEGTVCQSDLLDFEAAFDILRGNAYGISECETNVQLLDQNGNPLTDTEGNFPPNMKIEIIQNEVNVWNLTIDAINSIPNLTFVNQPNANSPLVINVTGTGGNDDFYPFNAAGIGGNVAPYILFNFIDMEALLITGSSAVWGSVLAPNSNIRISNPNNVEGQVVGMEVLIMAGEVHHRLFDAHVPVCAAVPVSWLRFEASLETDYVALEWSTANEEGNEIFVVEQSKDLKEWAPIGTVAGRGYSSVEQHYFFKAPRPENKETYYRIQQVDYDGQYSYSTVRAIRMNEALVQWQVVPNPFENSTELRFSGEQNANMPQDLRIVDLQGRLVKSYVVPTGTPSFELNLSDLPNGLYFLQMQTGSGWVYEKIRKGN